MSNLRAIQRMNEVAIDLIKGVPSGPNDPDQIRGDTGDVARTMALLNVALSDAVTAAMGGKQDREEGEGAPHLLVNIEAVPAGSPEAAAVSAGRVVLLGLFAEDSRRKCVEETSCELIKELGPKVPDVLLGQVIGAAVGGQILALRQFDVPPQPPRPPERDGGFNRPWRAQYAQMRPFVMDSPGQFLAPPPPPSASLRYAEAWQQVRRLGERVTKARTPAQTAAAMAWNGGANTSRPTGAWFEVAVAVADDKEYSTEQIARIFGVLGLTIADCMISSWFSKQTYDYWRPHDAIRTAHLNGNAGTMRDLGWLQLSSSPGGSPEYTSGTATFAGGASTVLEAAFGNETAFTLNLQKDLRGGGEERPYNSFSEAAEEAGMSRIYNGIHFQFANEAGMEAGRQVAQLVLDKHPLPSPP